MPLVTRLAGVAAAAAAALALAGPAVAADPPEFVVVPYATGLGRPADTELDLTIPADYAAPARIVIYVPTGYGATLNRPAGTAVGTFLVTLAVGGSTVPVRGAITAEDPARHTADACAPGAHAGVFLLSAGAINVPVYADATTGAEVELGAYKLEACLPSPRTIGGRLTSFIADFETVFVNPSTTALHRWRLLLTPYGADEITPNAAATIELRSLAPIPQRLTLRTRWDKRRKRAVITGQLLTLGRPERGIVVEIYAGRTLAGLKRVARVKTNRQGRFTITRKISRTTLFWAYVPVYFGNCTGPPSAAPGGCLRETVSPVFAPVVRQRR